ncbi:hypothetical protein NG891_10350 [Enterococcus gallinarum]|uniref:hypothetical protein n=1 Tax=Enterococcus TaxID=1350 RepID=UPI00209166CF|nr:hypothetical protein [Enterococcus gallinarum]MCO5477143.1 hypothetical protein [Enterococcus gallinarum]
MKNEELKGYLHTYATVILEEIENELTPRKNRDNTLNEDKQQLVNNYYNLSDDELAKLFFKLNDSHNAHSEICDETYKVADDGLTIIFALFARLGYIK